MQPHIQIAVDSYVGAFLAIGFVIPIVIASLAAGYILGTYILGSLGKTVLGRHVRHWFTRRSPSKFFAQDTADGEFVRRIVREELGQ